MDYKFTDKKLEFSPRAQQVKVNIEARLKEWSYREGTITNLTWDGELPFIDAFEKHGDELPYVIVLAKAISDSWVKSPVVIHPGEMIVGETRPTRPFVEHFSWGISDYSWVPSMSNFPDNGGDPDLYGDRKEEIRTRAESVKKKMFIKDTEEMCKAEDELFGGADIGGLWGTGGFQGHTVPGYEKLLSWGFDKTIEEINKYDANTNDRDKHDLYEAMRRIVRGLSEFAENYSRKASDLAATEDDPDARARLDKISRVCMKVAHEAPEDYYEAAQLTWFYSLWDWVDSVGRVDKYLYPFYVKTERKSLKEDVTSDLIMKMWEHGVHNMTLGGLDTKSGKCSVNELTYLILQTIRTIHNTHPRVTLRVSEDTPDDVMMLVATMWSEGMSDPTLASDTLIVNGLTEIGVSTEDARDYSLLGCQEIEIPGKSNFGCEDGSFNVAKVLEYTINSGCRAGGTKKLVPFGRKLSEYCSVDEIWEDYKKNIEYLVPHFCHLCDLGQEIRNAKFAKLVKTVYTDDCISRGINLDGGGAVYNYGVAETAGVAVTADSFTALEKLVYNEKTVDIHDLEKALADNFTGHDELRHKLLNAPKFGNDDDTADIWAVRVLDHFWNELGKYKSVRGGKYLGACSLLTGGVDYGYGTSALPDGHRQGDPLGNTMGPRPGADTKGITSLLKSVSKLPLKIGLGGTTLNVLVPCAENVTSENKIKIIALLKTFLANGGQLLQVTTANKEVLLEAQKAPENHRDVIVRVGGYSSPFVDVSKANQDEIISRYN